VTVCLSDAATDQVVDYLTFERRLRMVFVVVVEVTVKGWEWSHRKKRFYYVLYSMPNIESFCE